jgi:DNA-binding IclR family transcriptional regulator
MPRGNRRRAAQIALPPAAAAEGGEAAPPDGQFVEALARGLRLLECFRDGDDQGLGNKDFAERTGLSAPTVSRLCHTLQRLGYLVYDTRTGRYAMGPAVLKLSYVLLRNIDLRHIARPLLRDFAERTRITVAVNMRDRLRMVVLEGVSGTSPVALRLDVGSRIPIVSTAAGRAYLAGLVLADARELLDEIRLADPQAWEDNQAGIDRACDEVRARGFCTTQGGWHKEVNGVAVPLYLKSAGGQLSLSCGGPAQDLPARRMERELGPLLLEVKDEIARRVAN